MPSKILVDAIVDLQEGKSVELTRQLLEEGVDPLEILGDCREAMMVIGQRFEREEAFLPELMMAGEIQKITRAATKP